MPYMFATCHPIVHDDHSSAIFPSSQATQFVPLNPPPRSSLDLANKHRLENVAFPAISTGVYGYPKGEGAEVGRGGS